MSRDQHLYTVGFMGSFSVCFMSNSFTVSTNTKDEKNTTDDKFLLSLSESENERRKCPFA